MINIAKPEKAVTDPFSGAGGILLEASLLGYTANGIDFDTRMIERAKENLSAFDSEANLKHGNALETEWPDGVIVTDVPYGKNSAVSEGADALFKNFVQRMKAENRTGVVCYPKRVETVNTVKKVYGEVESYDFYVNKSLTRRISVLR
jgi:tRNA (guanine10-N2)-dimethyltransferase